MLRRRLATARRVSRGFTIVELMVALGISAILVAIAAPTMRSFIENARIRAASESLQNGLALARNEAVRSNQRIEFVTSATGWVVRVPGAGTSLHTATGDEGRRGLTLTTTPNGADRITYDSFGRAAANADASATLTAVNIVSTNPPSSSSYRPLRVQIQATGAPRLCNPSAASTHPSVCL